MKGLKVDKMTNEPSVKLVTPVFAYDVKKDGYNPVDQAWPSLTPDGDGIYRWIHLDLNMIDTAKWLRAVLPDVTSDTFMQKDTRPRCEEFGDGFVLNLRAVNLTPGESAEDMVSLSLWITGSCMISGRLSRVWAADEIRQQIDLGHVPLSVGKLLNELVRKLTQRIDTVSRELENRTDELEESDAEWNEMRMEEVLELRRNVIKMRRFVKPQIEALRDLIQVRATFLDANSKRNLGESANRTQRVLEELDSTRDRLSLIMEHHQADGARLMNKNSYLLSIIAAIFLPLSFVTGLFGVNVGGMPGVEWNWAFALLAMTSVVFAIILYFAFKFLRWF